ncbi:sialoadhesin-like [Triplophysa dalaica]|uniref:sialoadhesin-like n=1 Tax=Triplophysa dalaica TaxID=1582913 RepID=UPI0024E01D42|nr:sialoadhesin-like [Triplophysa dalaica]
MDAFLDTAKRKDILTAVVHEGDVVDVMHEDESSPAHVLKLNGMTGQFLFHLLLKAVLLYETLAWEVKMPKEIHGLKGSCLVIPCSFSYTSYPPTNPNRVVWYQWVSKGYPIVYDLKNPSTVIEKFKGKTALYGNTSNRDCSLVITHLDQSHHGQKLYAWIDPDSIGWRTYKFYDVTTTILVDASPEKPTINVNGGVRTGDNITVTCETYHTCPYSKPNITLSGIEGSDKIQDIFGKGQWKITLTRTGVVKAEHLDIECIVTHYGGITASATKSQSAKCVSYNVTIEPELAEVIEGVVKNFTCTVNHSCQKEHPTISWKFNDMQVTGKDESLTKFNSTIVSSTVTILGAKKDHGKKLTCTGTISEIRIAAFVVLHAQLFDLKTTGLYILVPSSCVVLLICALAGVVKCKRSQRPSPDMQESQPAQSSKDVCSVSANKPFSKPRMPSPNSQRKSGSDHEDYYTNMEELNMYGNI